MKRKPCEFLNNYLKKQERKVKACVKASEPLI